MMSSFKNVKLICVTGDIQVMIHSTMVASHDKDNSTEIHFKFTGMGPERKPTES